MNAAKTLAFGSAFCPTLWLLPPSGKLEGVPKKPSKQAEEKAPTDRDALHAWELAKSLASSAILLEPPHGVFADYPASLRNLLLNNLRQRVRHHWALVSETRLGNESDLRATIVQACRSAASGASDTELATDRAIAAFAVYVDTETAEIFRNQRAAVTEVIAAIRAPKKLGRGNKNPEGPAIESLFTSMNVPMDYKTWLAANRARNAERKKI